MHVPSLIFLLDIQCAKVSELLGDADVHAVLTSPFKRCQESAMEISQILGLAPECIESLSDLRNPSFGTWQGRPALEVQGAECPLSAASLALTWERAANVWRNVVLPKAGENGGQTIVVVGHSAVLVAIICHSLGLGQEHFRTFRLETASVTIIDFADRDVRKDPILRTCNYTVHKGGDLLA